MHINELQRIVTRLSNAGWVRWWAHFNYPNNPVQMAIQVLDVTPGPRFGPVPVMDLEDHGFEPIGDHHIYLVNRTDDDGNPYNSKL